jgi:hypothetical protein
MWRRVEIVLTDVSEERIASIFRGQRSANKVEYSRLPALCRNYIQPY